jgi:two-component system response regulator YesN
LFCSGKRHSQLYFHNIVNDCIIALRGALKRYYNITACYGVSKIVDSPGQVAEAHSAMGALLGDKIYHGNDIIIREKMPSVSPGEHYGISIGDERAISVMLKSAGEEELKAYIRQIFEDRRKAHLDAGRLQIVLAELLNLLNRELREFRLDIIDVCPLYHQIFGRIQYMSLDEMKECVLDCYKKVLDALSGISYREGQHAATKQACSYVSRNYVNNISLTDVAANIGVTPSYLSRVFKKDMDRTVVEYLNQIRIERAKKMIDDGGVRLNKLYSLVGFNSNTYFFTVFKQNTGFTPTQYKKQAGNT